MSDGVSAARDVAKLIDGLPSLPITFQRINEVVNHPACTTTALAEVVIADQGLASRILRLANSSFYGLSARVDTISKAVGLIGTRQLRDLALGAAVMDLFKDLPPGTIDTKGFWEHSLAVGAAARVLAQQQGERAAERHFVAGLLHDLGHVALSMRMPNQFIDILAQSRAQFAHMSWVERKNLGFDHAELGAALLEHWRLPEPLVEAVSCHHRMLTTAKYVNECSAVHVGEVLVEALGYGVSCEPVVPSMDPPAWDMLGLQPQCLAAVAEALERQVVELQAIFMS